MLASCSLSLTVTWEVCGLHASCFSSYSGPYVLALTLPTCYPQNPGGVTGFSHWVSTAYISSCFRTISYQIVTRPTHSSPHWYMSLWLISTFLLEGLCLPSVTPLLFSPPAHWGSPLDGPLLLNWPVLCPAHRPPGPALHNSPAVIPECGRSLPAPLLTHPPGYPPFCWLLLACVSKLLCKDSTLNYSRIFTITSSSSHEKHSIFLDNFVSFRNCTHSLWLGHTHSQAHITSDSRVLVVYIVKICQI